MSQLRYSSSYLQRQLSSINPLFILDQNMHLRYIDYSNIFLSNSTQALLHSMKQASSPIASNCLYSTNTINSNSLSFFKNCHKLSNNLLVKAQISTLSSHFSSFNKTQIRNKSTLIIPNYSIQNVQSRNSSSNTIIESQKENYIPNFYNVLYSENYQEYASQKTGLFQIDKLTDSLSLYNMRKEAQEKCELLRESIKKRPITDIKEVLNQIDEISNTLCIFLDLVEFLRNVHPSRKFQSVANETWLQFHSYLHSLNADSSIHSTLREIIAINESLKGTGKEFNEEQERVALLLTRDMEKNGGIHIENLDSGFIQEMNEKIDRLVGEFVNFVETDDSSDLPEDKKFWVNEEEKAYLYAIFNLKPIKTKKVNGKTIYFYNNLITNALLFNCPNSEVRRKAYISSVTISEKGNNHLRDMVKARNEYALYMKFPSYAHWATKDNVIQSPERAIEFLNEIHKLIQPKINQELQLLKNEKLKYENTSELYQWDQNYYSKLIQKNLGVNQQISAYLPLHRCLEGIYMICEKTFSIRLEPVPMKQGESWDPLVRKLEVIHKIDGVLGYIYLDLHRRANKITTCANFSVRVAKKLSNQKPISCMVCDFQHSKNDVSLLTLNELSTLFHEFGHALHTILGQSNYQCCSGTRTSIDFVEMPSQFMECFVYDYNVLKNFALHYKTNEPLPFDIFQNAIQRERLFLGLQTEYQILLSIMDLKMFGAEGLTMNPSEIYKQVKENYSSFPHVEGTNPESKVLHFSNYASGYYSYLFCKMCSNHIYYKLFDKNPFNNKVGEEYIAKVLRPGGSKNPIDILQDILNEKPNPKYLIQEFGIEHESI